MPKEKDERDERMEEAVEIIDVAFEGDDEATALQAAIAWILLDIADSLEYLTQVLEAKAKGFAHNKPRRSRKGSNAAPKRKARKPAKPAKKRARVGADEEDE